MTHRDIYAGSPMYLKMLELHGQGLSYRAIAEHPDIQKDRTTILHHLRAAGIQPHPSKRMPSSGFFSEERMLERARQREEQRKKRMLERKPKDIDFGPGRCHECGIKIAEMPNHNCAPGSYFKRNDLGGNGTGEEMV